MAVQDVVATVAHVVGAVEKPHRRRKTERRKEYGKFNRIYVLCFWSILDYLSCWCQHLPAGFMDKEMA